MTGNALFRINVQSGEIEIQGSEEFVERQLQRIDEIIEKTVLEFAAIQGEAGEVPENEPREEPDEPATSDSEVPEAFGEWLVKFPKELNDQEKALVAGYFLQHHSGKSFTSAEVSNLLREQGIIIPSPSTQLKRLAEKKLIFVDKREGRSFYYKVSRKGQEYIHAKMQA